MNDAAQSTASAETPRTTRTARELRDAADRVLDEIDIQGVTAPEFRDGVKLAHELSLLAEVTNSLEEREHWREQERKADTEQHETNQRFDDLRRYRELAEKYEAALRDIAAYSLGAPNSSRSVGDLRGLARIALGGPL